MAEMTENAHKNNVDIHLSAENPQIQSECFQAYPLAAHFHELKRRLGPVFQQSKCFMCVKGHVFAQLYIMFVHFWEAFAYFWMILHYFVHCCIARPKTPQKETAKMTVYIQKSQKKRPKWAKMGKKFLKWPQNLVKPIPKRPSKRYKNESKMIPMWPKMTPKRPENEPIKCWWRRCGMKNRS